MQGKRICSGLLASLFLWFGGLRLSADGEEAVMTSAEGESSARSAVLIEASTGQVLYEKDAHQPLPVGTLNKVMTALLTAEAISRGEISMETMVTASEKAHTAKGAVIWLDTGEQMTVEELLKALLIGNANDAAIALSEKLSNSEDSFVRLMNSRARELGMSSAVFKNPSGYDAENQGCSAYEMAVLCRELLKYEFLTPIMTCYMTELRGGATQLVNSNRLVRTYEGILGIKSSYTDASGFSLAAAARRDGVSYIAVVLGSGDKDDCFAEGKRLLNLGFTAYEVVSPSIPSQVFGAVRVRHGTSPEVGLRAEGFSSVVVKKGDSGSIRTEVMLPTYVEAPVQKGEVIGEISYYYGDTLICRRKLQALSDVEKMTVGKALCKMLKLSFEFS